MADTTAYFLQYGLDQNDLIDSDGVTKINDFTKSDVEQFVVYGYALQYYSGVQNQISKSENKLNDLYYVMSHYDAGLPIVINIKQNTLGGWGHTVIPVGIKKVSNGYDIYLNDSENYQKLYNNKIHLVGTYPDIAGWSYIQDGTEQISNSTFAASISWAVPTEYLHNYVQNKKIEVEENNNLKNVLTIFAGAVPVHVGNTAINLAVADGYVEDTLIPIRTFHGTELTGDEQMYWANAAQGDITATAASADSRIVFACGDSAVEVSLTPQDSVTASVDNDGRKTVSLDTARGHAFSCKVTVHDNESDCTTAYRITGTAAAETVVISQTDDGIAFENIASGTYTKKVSDTLTEEKIIVNDSLQPRPVLRVAAPAEAVYKKAFTVSADVQDLPIGTKIVWTANNDKVQLLPSADGLTCQVAAAVRGSVSLTATVVGADGTDWAQENAAVTVEYTWWQWLIIILLFGWIWY